MGRVALTSLDQLVTHSATNPLMTSTAFQPYAVRPTEKCRDSINDYFKLTAMGSPGRTDLLPMRPAHPLYQTRHSRPNTKREGGAMVKVLYYF